MVKWTIIYEIKYKSKQVWIIILQLLVKTTVTATTTAKLPRNLHIQYVRWFLNVTETCLFASVGYMTLIGLHPINLRDRHRAAVRLGVRLFPSMEQLQTEHRIFIWGFGGALRVTDTFILLGWVVSGRNIHAGLDHIIMWLLLLFKSASIPKSVSGTEYFTVNWAFIREKWPKLACVWAFPSTQGL